MAADEKPLVGEGAPPSVGYRALLRGNADYRNVWLGALVSLTGDWFSMVAVLELVLEFTGSGEAVGIALITRFVPSILWGPLAGAVADRLSRKQVMVVCDIIRAVVVLGFLLIRSSDQVLWVYVLLFVQTSVTAFFDPAEQAAIGSVARPNEVVTANTLHAMTWSFGLTVGAAIGGAVTALVGRDAAFVIDAGTFLVSAAFVMRARIRHVPDPAPVSLTTPYRDIAEGIKLLMEEPRVRRVILAKAGWGLSGGGALLLYTLFAERVFWVGGRTAAALGILLGARGLGALVGPLLARLFRGDDERWLQQAIGGAFFVTGIAYLGFSVAPNIWLGAAALFVAHMCVSTQWVFSTALLNLWVPNRLRGRTFAADMTLLTVAMSGSAFVTGRLLDAWSFSPRVLMAFLGLVLFVPAVAWEWMGRRER